MRILQTESHQSLRSWLRVSMLAGFMCGWLCLPGLAQETAHTPSLLLTPKLLRRLQRDKERQTVRWQNFARRVESVADSPERGFELALYYAVTHDEGRGKEAVAWAVAHRCELRQAALVLDWVGDAVPPDARKVLSGAGCPSRGEAETARDALLLTVAQDRDPQAAIAQGWPVFRSQVHQTKLLEPATLYAMCEFLLAARANTHDDLRNQEALFFSQLPKQFLLSLRPEQVEHPDWMAHIAALALVSMDPNLENSQFLQGWGMEESQMLRDGPGVAYEFLWADPYLPGIAYQNMDPWAYDPAGNLFARSNWDAEACWVAVSPKGTAQTGCDPHGAQPATFGTLKLQAMPGNCVTVPARTNRESEIIWKLQPKEKMVFEHEKQKSISQADAGGMWPAPNDAAGRVCVETPGKR